eukprot:m.271668 g.271668  ORF g.271668 m.271668 type:complete len:57 (+) comp15683_c14_seq3:2563-2733(+)
MPLRVASLFPKMVIGSVTLFVGFVGKTRVTVKPLRKGPTYSLREGPMFADTIISHA